MRRIILPVEKLLYYRQRGVDGSAHRRWLKTDRSWLGRLLKTGCRWLKIDRSWWGKGLALQVIEK